MGEREGESCEKWRMGEGGGEREGGRGERERWKGKTGGEGGEETA